MNDQRTRSEQQLFRRKPAATLMADAESHAGGLKRALGALDLTLLGIGAIVGAGIFVMTGVGARQAGPGLIASFVLAGTACTMAALCYAEFAAMIPVAGSAYSYSYATMGELVGMDHRMGSGPGICGRRGGRRGRMVGLLPRHHGGPRDPFAGGVHACARKRARRHHRFAGAHHRVADNRAFSTSEFPKARG